MQHVSMINKKPYTCLHWYPWLIEKESRNINIKEQGRRHSNLSKSSLFFPKLTQISEARRVYSAVAVNRRVISGAVLCLDTEGLESVLTSSSGWIRAAVVLTQVSEFSG